jgi:hypothetical protein
MAEITSIARYSEGKYVVTSFDGGVQSEPYEMPAGYRLSMLEAEIRGQDNATFEVRSYNIPELKDDDRTKWERELRSVQASLAGFEPVMAHINDDGSFVAINITEDGISRDWDDFRTFALKMMPNTPKRLGALTTWTYMNRTLENVTFVSPGMIQEHIEGEVSIMLHPDPEDVHTVDGEVYMRRELYMELVAGMERELMAYDEDHARIVIDKHLATDVGTIRGISSRGLIKGNVVICDYLPADILVHDSNLKKELIGTNSNELILHINPEKQMGKVNSNRQSVANFYEVLFNVPTPGREDSENLLKDAFRDYLGEIQESFVNGELLPFEEGKHREQYDSIRTHEVKRARWVEAGLSLNQSMELTLRGAGRIRLMFDNIPEFAEDKRRTRMHAPYAESWHAKSFFSFAMSKPDSTVQEPSDDKFEFFTNKKLGLITGRNLYARIMNILGGGDLDDKVEAHYRKAMADFTFLGTKFKKGEIIAFVLRNPIGLASDLRPGEAQIVDRNRIGSEYFILRPTKAEARRITRKFGELPELDPSLLPMNIAELGELHIDFPEVKHDLPESYSKQYFWEKVKFMGNVRGAYGTHVLQRMNFRILDLTFVAGGYEEQFIDACSKTRHPEELVYIKASNAEAEKQLKAYYDSLSEDEIIAQELSNPINQLVNYHREHTALLMEVITAHVKDVREELKDFYSGAAAPSMVDAKGRPILFHWMEKSEKFFLKKRNQRALRGTTQYEAVGTVCFNALAKKVTEGELTADQVKLYVLEAYEYSLANNRKTTYVNAHVERLFFNTDAKVMQGRMLDLLIKALTE